MDRRKFNLSAVMTAGLIICNRPCHAQFPIDANRTRTNPNHQSFTRSNIETRGCHLMLSGFSDGDIASRLLQSSGDGLIDSVFTREVVNFMGPMFGLFPVCRFYDDSESPNAFATPENLLGGNQGTIGFGVNLLQTMFQTFSGRNAISMGDHAACAVLAHEFGHIAQFNLGLPWNQGARPELHADFLAGWYMGIRARQVSNWQPVNISEAAEQMFNVGDTEFTSPNHHGTPHQRYMFFLSGVNGAINGSLNSPLAAYNSGMELLLR